MLPAPGGERLEDRVEVARRSPARRRSSGSSRARAPTRRRWCRRRRSECRSAAASSSAARRPVEGVAAVDDRVSGRHALGQVRHDLLGGRARRHHHPHDARRPKRPNQVVERRRAGPPSAGDRRLTPSGSDARSRRSGRPASSGEPCSRPCGPVLPFRLACDPPVLRWRAVARHASIRRWRSREPIRSSTSVPRCTRSALASALSQHLQIAERLGPPSRHRTSIGDPAPADRRASSQVTWTNTPESGPP